MSKSKEILILEAGDNYITCGQDAKGNFKFKDITINCNNPFDGMKVSKVLMEIAKEILEQINVGAEVETK